MNFIWLKASSVERNLLQSITMLVGNDQRLLTFLFDTDSPRLRKRAGILKEESWQLNESEQLLVRAALDIWSGSGHLQFWEMLEKRDIETWQNFIGAIRMTFDTNRSFESAKS